METENTLQGAYALETPEDSKELYRDWAASYDKDFIADHGYVLHQRVAEAYAKAGGPETVLDLGAGTGAVGAALLIHGYSDIHATDISPEMLEIARTKGIYSDLFEGNILERLPKPDHCFGGIVSAGTFTLGHVGPEGLDEVIRLLAPGGLAVISVRDTHYESTGFAQKISASEPLLRDITSHKVPIYAQGTTGSHADDQAVLLHLRKA